MPNMSLNRTHHGTPPARAAPQSILCRAGGASRRRGPVSSTLGVTAPLARAHMKTLTILAAVLFCSVQVMAQPALDVQGTLVAVGEARQVVLQRLSRFHVTCVASPPDALSSCDSMLVQMSAGVYSPLANVYFRDGKVRGVRKYWDRAFEGTTPGPFVQALYEAILQLQRETGVVPTVSTSERRDPGSVQQSIVLTAGRRVVSISYALGLRGPDGAVIPPFVNLNEVAE